MQLEGTFKYLLRISRVVFLYFQIYSLGCHFVHFRMLFCSFQDVILSINCVFKIFIRCGHMLALWCRKIWNSYFLNICKRICASMTCRFFASLWLMMYIFILQMQIPYHTIQIILMRRLRHLWLFKVCSCAYGYFL